MDPKSCGRQLAACTTKHPQHDWFAEACDQMCLWSRGSLIPQLHVSRVVTFFEAQQDTILTALTPVFGVAQQLKLWRVMSSACAATYV